MRTIRSPRLRMGSVLRAQRDRNISRQHNNPRLPFGVYTIATKRQFSRERPNKHAPSRGRWYKKTHLVPHQTFLPRRRPRKPPLKVVLLTLPSPCVSEIEEDDDVASVAVVCVAFADLADEDEFLGGGVGDGCEDLGADFDADVVRFPVDAY